MTEYILPPEPAPGSIVVFGKEGSGFPVERGMGDLWFRVGWVRRPGGSPLGMTWPEVVQGHVDDLVDGETAEERAIIHVLRDGYTV